MPIDWFTVAAQALNFLVLVWLMKRFLYRPILDAIDAREKRIAGELATAATTMDEARAQRAEFQHKNELLDQERADLMKTAASEAAAEGQRLLKEARDAADSLAAKRRESLRKEIRGAEEALSRHAREEVFAIARKTLIDLASVSVEERIIEVFCTQLRDMDAGEKASFAEALRTASEPALIRSAFELTPDLRAAIQSALADTFAMDRSVRFETAPELVGGIELIVNGRKVAWSIAGYLASLEKVLGDDVEAN